MPKKTRAQKVAKDRAKRAKTKTAKEVKHWQIVENVVAAFERRQGVAKVTQKAMIPMRTTPSQRREVDVLAIVEAAGRTFRVGIDVKNEKRPLDFVALDAVATKLNSLHLDKRVIVSTSGFAATARAAYAKEDIELLTMQEVETLDWSDMRVIEQNIRHYNFTSVGFGYDSLAGLAGMQSLGEQVVNNLRVRGSSGQVVTLLRFFMKALDLVLVPDLPNIVPDYDKLDPAVRLTFNTTLHADQVRDHVVLSPDGRSSPMPSQFKVSLETWVEKRLNPCFNYRYSDGSEAVTGVFALPNSLAQLSLVRPAGSDEVHIVIGPGEPPQVDV